DSSGHLSNYHWMCTGEGKGYNRGKKKKKSLFVSLQSLGNVDSGSDPRYLLLQQLSL
ncbi:unnamed protein product, partial [Bubo scandiacus]